MSLLFNTIKQGLSRYWQSAGASTTGLLQPLTPALTLVNGFKMKAVVKRRCRDCYMVVRDGRLYNLCNTHPRHKVMSLKTHEKKLRIISWTGQGRERPW